MNRSEEEINEICKQDSLKGCILLLYAAEVKSRELEYRAAFYRDLDKGLSDIHSAGAIAMGLKS